MRVIPGVENWPAGERCSALALGVFDGVHTGHQKIAETTVEMAAGGCSCLMTFHPHPAAVIGGAGPEFLTTVQQKAQILAGYGLDAMIVEPFTPALAATPHNRFAEMIMDRIHPQSVIVGRNFHYGRGGRGDVLTLGASGKSLGFCLRVVEPVMLGDAVVSSTAIRSLLREGDLEGANRMLGRPYSVNGEVTGGDGRGRNLGFPTANVLVEPGQALPPRGVYAVQARLEERRLPAMANLGTRPTFGQSRQVLEVHIIGFSEDIYGQTLDVDFVEFLRHETQFPGGDELVLQMKRDRQHAMKALQQRLGFVYNAQVL